MEEIRVSEPKWVEFKGIQEHIAEAYIEFLKESLSQYTDIEVGKTLEIYPAYSHAFLHPTKTSLIIVDVGGAQNITPTLQGVGQAIPYVEGLHYILLSVGLNVHVITPNEIFSNRLATFIFLLTEAHKKKLTQMGFLEVMPRSMGDTIVISDDTQAFENAHFDVPITIEVQYEAKYLLELVGGAILNEIRLIVNDKQTTIRKEGV